MSRSRNRQRGSSPSRSGFSALLALFSSGSVFTADRFALDGVSGKVASFSDWFDASHTIVQATSANQVAAPAASALFAGRVAAAFAGAQVYVSNRGVASWKFRHDGTGYAEVNIYKPAGSGTGILTATQHGSGGHIGLWHGFSSTPSTRVAVNNGSAAIVSYNSGSKPTAGAATYTTFEYSESASPKYAIRDKSSLLTSGSPSGSPSSSNPTYTFRIGADNSGSPGGNYATMDWVATFIRPSVLSTSDRAALQAAIQSVYGIAP